MFLKANNLINLNSAILKMIFTNQTKIKVLETELKNMAVVLKEVRDDVREIRKFPRT